MAGSPHVVGYQGAGVICETGSDMRDRAVGEILVSSAVKDLVAGSGLSFDGHGIRALKGVPDEWRLDSVRV